MKRPITNIIQSPLLLALLALLSIPLGAQLASWNPNGLTGYGPSPWAPTASSTSMTVGGWTRGSTVGQSGNPAQNAWGGNVWSGASTCDATFTITSNPGSVVSYTAFNLWYRRSTTGPASGTLEYAFGSSTVYTVINTFTFSSTSSSGAAHPVISLTGISGLQSVSPGTVVKFRIMPAAGTTTAGTWYIFGSGASIEGSISAFNINIQQTASITCQGQSNGELTATPIGGTAPFTYSWLPVGGTSSVVSNLAAGVYTCIITSANSETAIGTYTLTAPSAITTSLLAQANITCGGSATGAATVSASGGSPAYTYSWIPSGGTSSVGTGMAAGNYTVIVKDLNNCTGSKTVTITQPIGNLSVTASHSVVCQGATVSLSASGASTYTWSGGVINGLPFSPSITTTYSVASTNTVTGCTDSNTMSIAVNENPTLTAVSNLSVPAVCNGGTISLSASGANSYTWSGSISNGVAFTPSSTATYSVAGTDTNNCVGSATISVVVNQPSSLTIAPTRTTICRGETSSLTVSGSISYTWNTAATTTMIVISPTANLVYSVTAKDANGCVSTGTVLQKVSSCAGIESYDRQANAFIELFPNPNNGEFTIRASARLELSIINEFGQTVRTVSASDPEGSEIHIQNLSAGVYFILSNTPGYSVKQKLIITH